MQAKAGKNPMYDMENQLKNPEESANMVQIYLARRAE